MRKDRPWTLALLRLTAVQCRSSGPEQVQTGYETQEIRFQAMIWQTGMRTGELPYPLCAGGVDAIAFAGVTARERILV